VSILQSKRISVGLVLSVGVVGVSLTASHSSTNAVLDELDSKAPDFRWLDVTTQNFDETLPVFEEHLKKAVFVSIDTEFTGLTKPGAEDPTYKDMPYEYYRKKALSAREFIPVQIGVCVFVKPQDVSDQFRVPLAPQIQEAAERNLLVALPFNFYVFPRQYTHNATKLPDEKSSGTWRRSSDPALRHDPSFLAQSGSIEFLAQHGYDFNKTFSQGISFLNADQEAHFKKIGFGEPVVAEQNEAAFNNALGFRYDVVCALCLIVFKSSAAN
jgi:poly(A)-specific ribonuclease